MKKNSLILFVRKPELGRVKTRLAASIGNIKTLLVYEQLLNLTKKITLHLDADKFLFYTDAVEMDDMWPTAFYFKKVQIGNNLGEKMQNAFSEVFKNGCEKAIIIGSDCPELTQQHIEDAFDKLDTNDVVVGPAFDGGYYLLGMKNNYSFLFENIAWSTQKVLTQTLAIIGQNGLLHCCLPTLSDMDELADLQKHHALLGLPATFLPG